MSKRDAEESTASKKKIKSVRKLPVGLGMARESLEEIDELTVSTKYDRPERSSKASKG